MFEQLTPEFFDTLIVVVIILGLALSIVRIYADFKRPLPDERTTRSTTSSEASAE